jgi:C_GCAxxG_C_C family probable redox protein
MTNELTTNRVNNAIALFEKGYNCSQAVFMAYADLYNIEQETAAKLATSFGGGMGRLREVCGAVSGMFLVLGLHYPFTDTKNKDSKNTNYKAVQNAANRFKEEMGSYICADLLHKKRKAESIISEERTDKYYAERPCTKCVRIAAEIVGKEILASR